MSSAATAPQMQYCIPSDRVKMVDMHPKEPIFIGAMYTGVVHLWNYDTQALLRSFDTGSNLPVRCARFIPRLQAFACGADDMQIRVYNYNTMERIKIFQAHDDYIRDIAVHEQFPVILTCSDDMTIRQWDWSKDWALQMTYDAHEYYCMAVRFNPNDLSTFASASLDGTVRVWNLNNPVPNFLLEGHEDGVNCVEYYPRGDKPYLLTGSDDQSVRLWDYQTKACVQTFQFHSANVTAVLFHPDLPLIFSVAEDGDMKVISTETFRLLHNVNVSRMGRGWCMAARHHVNALIVGFDNGVAVYKIGDDKPVYSMDSNGRVLVATGNDLTRIDLKGIGEDTADGEVLTVASKDLGTVEASPKTILHGPGGQFFALVGEREYTIVSALGLRPKTYGPCTSFVWGPESGSYAVLQSTTVTVFKGFKERATVNLPGVADKLFAGPLLTVRLPGSVIFYDWERLCPIRQIDESPKAVEWSHSGELVALVTDALFFLKFNAEEVAQYLSEHDTLGADGLDFSFDVIEQVDEKVRDLTWVGDCLVFVNDANRLCYYIGGEINNLAVLTKNHFLLGYVARENRVFCIDKERNITSYLLRVNVVEYMAAIVREDFDAAARLLPSIEEGARYKLAQFLQSRGLLEEALTVTTDDDHKFDLAIELKQLSLAMELTEKAPSAARWKQVGDIALEQARVDVATDCLWKCNDVSGLLLIFSSLNDMASLSKLGDFCVAKGKGNVAFTCFHLCRRYRDCVDLLLSTGKAGEAAFYARTYAPECIEDAVAKWKLSLTDTPRMQEAIANPASYPNLFPGVDLHRSSETPVADVHQSEPAAEEPQTLAAEVLPTREVQLPAAEPAPSALAFQPPEVVSPADDVQPEGPTEALTEEPTEEAIRHVDPAPVPATKVDLDDLWNDEL